MQYESLMKIMPANKRKPASAVVLLHGYGANARDLLPLAHHWQVALPHTLFIALQAPLALGNDQARSWFSLEDWSFERIWPLMPRLSQYIIDHVQPLLSEQELSFKKTALMGFSQGGAVAFSQALYLLEVRSALNFSGVFVPAPKESVPFRKTPCLWVHGDQDNTVPLQFFSQGVKALNQLQVDCESHLLNGLGHSINREGLDHGQKFLRTHLMQEHAL